MNDIAESNVQTNVQERVARIKETNEIVAQIQKQVLKENEHYGIIPGTNGKPTLLKPGAEKLAATFRLDPQYEIKKTDFQNGHLEYEITCQIYSIETGKRLGSGGGSCTTLESKYRYRKEAAFEVTDLPIPKDAKERKAEYRKQGFGMQKVDNDWKWVKYKESTRVENPDIADTYNTVLKMAMKRAFISAILTVLAVSDMFTQDAEDFVEVNGDTVDKSTGEIVEPKTEKPVNQDPPKSQPETKAKPEPEKNGVGKLSFMSKTLKAIVQSANPSVEKLASISDWASKWESSQDELTTEIFQKGMDLLEKAKKDAQGVAA